VLRAGYVILTSPPVRNDWGYGGFTYGYSAIIQVKQGSGKTGFALDPAIYLSHPFPSLGYTLPNTDPAAGNWNAYQAIAPDANRPTYVQNWNLGVQIALPAAAVLEAAYVGNKGTRVWGGSSIFGEMNGLPTTVLAMGDSLTDPVAAHPELVPFVGFPDNLSVAQALRPYPHFNSVQEAFPYNANSSYNAMQVTVTRHLTRGIGFLAAYTWSKALGYNDSAGPLSFLGYAGAGVQDYYNRKLERSIASFNYPQSLKLTWVYALPFGKARRWNLRALNPILGGWQFAAIQNYRSGEPVSVGQPVLTVPDGISPTIRPDLAFGQKVTLGPAPSQVDFFAGTAYLNADAFSPTPMSPNGVPLRVGTAPRFLSSVRGPHWISEQVRLSKRIPIRERAYAAMAVTAANPFSRTFRSFASTTVGDAGFGKLLAGGYGRTIQFETRIAW
jgi:hypothetical protein